MILITMTTNVAACAIKQLDTAHPPLPLPTSLPHLAFAAGSAIRIRSSSVGAEKEEEAGERMQEEEEAKAQVTNAAHERKEISTTTS